MEGGLADGLVGVSEELADEGAGVGVVEPGEGPHGVSTEQGRWVLQGVLAERGDHRRVRAGVGDDPHHVPLDRRSGVAQERDELREGLGRPEIANPVGHAPAERVLDLRRPRAPHPVDRARDVGLDELRGRAAELVPAPGVDHEQGAVGVLDHVGRVEVEPVHGGEEILVAAGERRPLGREDVAGDLVEVEAAGEEVISKRLAEGARLVPGQPARGGGAEVGEHGHHVGPGARVGLDHVVDLAVHAPIHVVQEAVAPASAGLNEEGRGEDPLAAGGEDDVDRVVHPAGHHGLDPRPVGPASDDMRGPRDERTPRRAAHTSARRTPPCTSRSTRRGRDRARAGRWRIR